MSGGSYNYLYCREPDELLDSLGDLEDMVDRLARLGYAQDAAEEAADMVLTVRSVMVRLGVMQRRLSPVFKAVEWWDSNDSGEDGVKVALEKYRGKS